MITTPLEAFMRESNWIEGERADDFMGILHPNDLLAARKFLSYPLTERSLKELHGSLSEGRDILRGEYRDCQVYVGEHTPPGPKLVPHLMSNLFLDLEKMDSHEAHIRFEKIHPFEDLNGRTGRLLWLHKFVGERGFTPSSFLQFFYYQTLSK